MEMLQGAGFSIGIIVLMGAMAAVYRLNQFHKRTIWYLSWVQFFYTVLVPLILMPMFYVYIKSILMKPRSANIFLSDDLILMTMFVSAMFAYGGLVVHGITKMMEGKVNKLLQPDLEEMRRFFHLTFSHNLTYLGAIVIGACVALLELNHVFDNQWGVFWAIVRGIGMGIGMLIALTNYASPNIKKKIMADKWVQMRFVFLTSWVLLFMFLWGIKKFNPQLDTYQMVIPMLVMLGMINFLSVVIVFKKLRGRWTLAFSLVRLDRLWRAILKGEW